MNMGIKKLGLFLVVFFAFIMTGRAQDHEQLSYSGFMEKVRETNGVILDVRTPMEYEAGHLENSILINFNSPEFLHEIKKLDKGKTYFLYCRTGNRSGKALGIMKNHGFEKVYHLESGIMGIQDASALVQE